MCIISFGSLKNSCVLWCLFRCQQTQRLPEAGAYGHTTEKTPESKFGS